MVTAESLWPCGGGWRLPGSSLVSPAPSVLVQFLPHRLPPSIRVLGAEVGTEAVGGESGRHLCTALERRLVGVQILLCKVGVRFCKPAKVGWRDEGTRLLGLREQTSRAWSSSLGLCDPPLPPHCFSPPTALAGVGSMFMVLEVRTRPTLSFSLLHTKSQQKPRGSHCILSYSCLGES